MSIPIPCDAIAMGNWRPQRTGIVVLGMLVFAVSAAGAWFSLGQPAAAAMPDVRPVASTQRPFIFTPYASPRPVENVEFEDGQGRKRTLADFRGKVVLLNIWATWCGPCRAEMPTLDRLQSQLGSKDFEVVALSIDRGGQAAVKSFFNEIDVHALAVYVDPSAEAGSILGIVGVPTTLLLDRMGREIGRVTGPAEWDGAEVKAMIQRQLAPRES